MNEEGGVSLAAVEKMALVKSVVWEAMRIEPPFPYQYGKAKEDVVFQSHDAAFVVKKGEILSVLDEEEKETRGNTCAIE